MNHNEYFKKAQPIWLKDREREMNVQAGFAGRFRHKAGEHCILRVTGAALYRICVNGSFVHYGPARAPHGYTRVDEIALEDFLEEGFNVLTIEAAGYYIYNYYTVKMPSFVQAEIEEEGNILGSTGENGEFHAIALTMRLQHCMRYSFQRHFTEVYRMDQESAQTDWVCGADASSEAVAVIETGLHYLPREVPVPAYVVTEPVRRVEEGTAYILPREAGLPYEQRKFIQNLNDRIEGYPVEEIPIRPFEMLQDCRFEKQREGGAIEFPEEIGENRTVMYDMGLNNTGFLCSKICAPEDCEICFVFDEKLIDGGFDLKSFNNINIVYYSLKKSEIPYLLESFEVYGFRYVQCIVLKGKAILHGLSMREYSYPRYRNARFTCSDRDISRIFEAAVQTYRQNTLDVFMDCPTRERAGWLCDSYFTAQVSPYLSGECTVERVMLKNYVLAPRIPFIADGILPACYPGDSPDGRYIPQWAMWYIIELEGYFKRETGADKAEFRDLCYRLLSFLAGYKNPDGLLEKLDKWNFIEWSAANKWVQDVNYPTNMLYSRVLHLVGQWYGDERLLQEAARVKETVLRQSFDGTFFIDNAVRTPDGELAVTGNRSEVCQYYALFFGIADPEEKRFEALTDTVLHVFGPDRKEKRILPEIEYANAFIGNYLRLELLLRWRQYRQALQEINGYYSKMADKTGTLWEHDDSKRGSLNHGFASFVGAAILKIVLGIAAVDPIEGAVELYFADLDIEASGYVDTAAGRIAIERTRENAKTVITCFLPEKMKTVVRKEEVEVIYIRS